MPSWVRDTGEVLRDNVKQYVCISTISVFADSSKPGMDERATNRCVSHALRPDTAMLAR